MLVTLSGSTTPTLRREASPEVICAAYARISRSPLPVHELRARAAHDVDEAREFLARIVHHRGHQSVAEHAVFNLDLVGVSRLVTETVEHSRLASYTERSQRYVRIGEAFTIPVEARELGLSKAFRALALDQHATYRALASRLQERGLGKASREDARYALGLATTTQLGLTANARSLLAMVERLEASPLHEARVLGSRLRRLVSRACPSLVPPAPREMTGAEASHPPRRGQALREPRLCWHTPDPEAVLREALSFSGQRWRPSPRPSDLPPPLPRAFEAVQFAFHLTLSATAFAQLKRHRMATLLADPYDPSLGITIPPTVAAGGMEETLGALARRSEELAHALFEASPAASSYALLNAHRRHVLLIVNARAFAAMARLRLDPHAQWDIRTQVALMTSLLHERLPSVARLMGLPEGGAFGLLRP